MKYLLAIVLAAGMAGVGSAWALSDVVIEYCFTTSNPKQCLVDIQRDMAVSQYQTQQEQQNQLQRDLARQQAVGMAAFGSGNALINGMNQGMQNMRVQPHVLPPAQNYQTR